MPIPVYPTLSRNPSRPIGESTITNTLSQGFDAGYEQRRKKSAPRRSFDIQYVALPNADYQVLKSFFLARGGEVESFMWTHPVTKEVLQVRYANSNLEAKQNHHNSKTFYWEVNFKLIQVL